MLFVIHSFALYIASGIVFTPSWALLVCFIELSAELTVGWLLGRWMGKEKIEALMQKNAKAKKMLGRLDGKAESVVFITRLLPMPYPVGAGSMAY